MNITLIDVRMEYKRSTGDYDTPLSNYYFDKVEYVRWLEEQLVKYMTIKKEVIPWEPIK